MRNPSLRHVYASVAELNNSLITGGALGLTDTGNNARKLEMLDEVSRLIDARAHRGSGFGPWVGTKYYDGALGPVLWLRADLADLDSLSIASGIGATPVTPTVDTDFYLAGIGGYEPPFRKIILHGLGSPIAFGSGVRLTAVTGTWSFPYRTRLLDSTLSASLNTDDTSVGVSDLDDIAAGLTLLVDDEQMYVSAIVPDDMGDTIVVERGVNGTTAAAHSDMAEITRYVYDPSVHSLCLRLAEKRWKAKDAGGDGSDGGGDVGTVSLREGEDTIIRRMIGATVMLSGQV